MTNTPILKLIQNMDKKRATDRKLYKSLPLLLKSEVANLASITVGMQSGMSTIF